MKLKTIFTSFALLLMVSAVSASVGSSKYHINDEQMNQQFSEAEDITLVTLEMLTDNLNMNSTSTAPQNFTTPQGADKQLVAGIICAASLLVFPITATIVPVHRLYLGTGGKTFKIFALYCITLGGCYVISVVDAIVLLINSEGDEYVENPKWLMWH
jgi:hypothetical protein